MVAEIRSNSRNDDRKHLDKAVKGKVTVKNAGKKRLEGAFIAEDAGTVKDYIFWDVLVPAGKSLIVDMIKKTADAIFFGDRPRGSNIYRERGVSYVKYDSPSYDRSYSRDYRNYSREPERRPVYQRRSAHDFDDIVLESREDAENVLDALVESTMRYGLTTVSDFYDLVGIEANYTDLKWGWYELSSAKVLRTRDGNGYIIALPRCVMINDD